MKFNIGMLVALVASSQLATALPVPGKWNGKDAEAAYKTCSVAGAAAYMVCRNTGHPIAGNVAAGGAVVAAGAEAAVKWSQSPLGQAAGRKVAAGACAAGKACSSAGKKVGSAASSAASSAGQHAASGAKAAACAVGKVCNAAGKAIGDAASKAAKGASSLKHSITGGGHREPDLEMGHHHRRRAQDEYEYSPVATREPEPEPEFESLETRDEAALYTRYAEPEPEPENSWDEMY